MMVCDAWSGSEYDAQDGSTALMNASWKGRADCVRLLIDAGADKEARNNVRGRSLLCPGRVAHLIFFPAS
jgi:hypothetical protein